MSHEKEGRRLSKLGEHLAAATEFQKAVRYDLAAEELVLAKSFGSAARCYEKAGDLERAALNYVRAGDPAGAANAFFLLGKTARAAPMYERAGELERAAQLYVDAGEFGKAGECYERMDQLNPAGEMFERAGQLIPAGECFMKTGLFGRAGRAFEAASAWGRAAQAWEQAGDLKRAAADLMQAGDRVAAARAHWKRGDYSESLHVIRNAVPSDPDYYAAMDTLFSVLAERGYLTPLDEKTVEAFERNPVDLESLPAFLDLVKLLRRCDLDEGVRRLSDRIREEGRNVPEVERVLDAIWAVKGDAPAAQASYETLLEESFDYAATTRRLDDMRDFQSALDAAIDAGLGVPPASEAATKTLDGRGTTEATQALASSAPPRSSVVETFVDQARSPAMTTFADQARSPAMTTFVDQARSPAMTTFADLVEGFLFDGRYRIVRKLGAGGIGAVFLAHDQSLDESVALKVLKPMAEVEDDVLGRFKQEIKITRRIMHPNVVRTYDFGECGSFPYVAMEYVEGRDLKRVLRESGAYPVADGIRVLQAVCGALEAAHRLDVVHRDIKPQNILIDTAGEVKLIDFGIAKIKDAVTATLTEMFIGTPEYISPEMALGNPVDRRTDIYSVGVVMYEMFCGVTPFRGGNLVSLLQRHVSEAPRPPHEHVPGIPRALEAAILKSLAKDPADRQSSATELGAELGAIRT